MIDNRHTTERHTRQAFIESRDVEGTRRVDYFPQRPVALSLLQQAEHRKGLDGDEALIVPAMIGCREN